MSEEKRIEETRASLWDIQKKTLDLVQKIQEQDGEVDEEQERQFLALELKRKDKVDSYRYTDITLDGEIRMLKDESKRFAAMAREVERLRERLKSYIADFMNQNGIRILEGSNSKISFKENPPHVEIDDEEGILDDFWNAYGEMIRSFTPPWIKIVATVDKSALKRMMKTDAAILPEGVRLVKDCRLEIK